MKRLLIAIVAAGILVTSCRSAPKPPTVDGSQREPVNKSLMDTGTKK
ncbi:MAG: hypothetical protein A4E57_03757 [Syntrophorhabdaceae bacterium PtaU1.Bin034]|jgi:hypothetical protein|nr:MAG: hypothetical protein A4E57_03757 [Syntrophorhabdaceae bacterium PtaU1.Bin034]